MSRPIERFEGDVLLAAGAVLAGLGVALGALGGHLLKDSFTPAEIELWRTAASYHMYHALGLIVVARLLSRHPSKFFRATCGLFILGIVLFSGSLYGIALTGEAGLGVIAPIGGLAFLAGWTCLAIGIVRDDRP